MIGPVATKFDALPVDFTEHQPVWPVRFVEKHILVSFNFAILVCYCKSSSPLDEGRDNIACLSRLAYT